MASPKSPDEPFAFQSREFLRKLCIGKKVAFTIEYSVQSIGRYVWMDSTVFTRSHASCYRQFGAVHLLNEGIQQENLCITIARAGWAKVKNAAALAQTFQGR